MSLLVVLAIVAGLCALAFVDTSHIGADHRPDWDDDPYSCTAQCRICGRMA